jgi:hypothetical protein
MGLGVSSISARQSGTEYLPSILVAFVLGPFVPYLPISVDPTFVVTVQSIILAFNDPGQGEVLELEGNSVLHPVVDVVGERDPPVNI